MIKAVIFDFDGVLVESVDIKTEAFVRLFKPEGDGNVARIRRYHLDNTGVSRFDKFRHIYANILARDLSDEEFASLSARFAALVEDAVVSAPFVRGAKEFLEAYADKLSLFVASATPQDEIVSIVARRLMTRYFAGVYGAPTTKGDAVASILSRSGMRGDEVVYVGDAMSDYRAAQLHGVRFVARISANEEIFERVSCVKVNDLIELPAVITSFGV